MGTLAEAVLFQTRPRGKGGTDILQSRKSGFSSSSPVPYLALTQRTTLCTATLRIMEAQVAAGKYPNIIMLALAPRAYPTTATQRNTKMKTTSWHGSFCWRR